MTKSIGTSTNQYGPLQPNFTFDLEDGYTVLIGRNNSGKSAILQLLFSKLVLHTQEVGPDKICLLLPERIFVDVSTETAGRTLRSHNSEFAEKIKPHPLQYHKYSSPSKSELPKLLLSHTDFINQVNTLTNYLSRFGFHPMVLRQKQEISFKDIAIILQGSGLRSIFSILAALTSPEIQILLIDEPELSLEPILQKILKDLLLEASKEKKIIVSTHSHLFLNRQNIKSNIKVVQEKGVVTTTPVQLEKELFEISFNLLGSSLNDLFFPENFLIVEGVSDQVIVEKVIELKGFDKNKVKVVSATSMDRVPNAIEAITNTLRPLVINDSPYSNRVVALIDQPTNTGENIRNLETALGDRLFKLDQSSIEKYLPPDLYQKCQRDKNKDIADLGKLNNDYFKQSKLKKDISNGIARILTQEDLSTIPLITSAVEKATNTSN